MFKYKHEAHKKYGEHSKSHCFLLVALMSLVFFIVVSIIYAAYLFIDATRIANVSGVHLTKNLALAVSDLKGNLYSDENRGIKDWMVHSDRQNGFVLKHPNDWEMRECEQECEGVFLRLKKYEDSSINKSLISVIDSGVFSLEDGAGWKEIPAKKGISWDDSWKEELVAGRMGIRTGKVKTDKGLQRDVIFWKDEQKKKIFYLEATYYTEKSEGVENIFNKIISEFKFI